VRTARDWNWPHASRRGVPEHLVGDPLRLRQILINLIGNAIKFTEVGEIILAVDHDPTAAEPGSLRFTVTDTGIGVARDQLDAIFSNFTQADSSTTRKYGGTGLGLAIAQRLVGLMDGRIWLESEVGKGSKFSFTARCGVAPRMVRAALKAGNGNSGDAMQQRFAAETANIPAASGPLMRILIAEDSPDNRLVVGAYLRREPYQVEFAENGKQAVAMFKSQRYAMVLMDIQMPELDGLAATRLIRQWETERAIPPTPIIALTASVLEEDVRNALAAGCNVHLAKPLKKQTLLEVIHHTVMLHANASPAKTEN
jgi:CheY-like chemotaxis protein